VNTVKDLNKSTAIAATSLTKAAAAVQVKLSSHGYYIDHPDSEAGEQLMADALGVADRDAMNGILRQLVQASMNGQKPDAVNLSFMISVIKSINLRQTLELVVRRLIAVTVIRRHG
jgi:hypothetical protein